MSPYLKSIKGLIHRWNQSLHDASTSKKPQLWTLWALHQCPMFTSQLFIVFCYGSSKTLGFVTLSTKNMSSTICQNDDICNGLGYSTCIIKHNLLIWFYATIGRMLTYKYLLCIRELKKPMICFLFSYVVLLCCQGWSQTSGLRNPPVWASQVSGNVGVCHYEWF
jgi:hypothetical protein